MTTTTLDQADQLEALRANLRDLIKSSGRTLQEIIDVTGIPRSTLYERLNEEGSAISVDEMWKIWQACGQPGKISDLGV